MCAAFRSAVLAALLFNVLVRPVSADINSNWFPKKDMLTIGAHCYPEAWPELPWARDMANIRKLGMEYVHMGEFAWYYMEPAERHSISRGWRKT